MFVSQSQPPILQDTSNRAPLADVLDAMLGMAAAGAEQPTSPSKRTRSLASGQLLLCSETLTSAEPPSIAAPTSMNRPSSASKSEGSSSEGRTSPHVPGRSYLCRKCGREYASTDAVRKHARMNHLEWLRAQGQGCPSLYCTVVDAGVPASVPAKATPAASAPVTATVATTVAAAASAAAASAAAAAAAIASHPSAKRVTATARLVSAEVVTPPTSGGTTTTTTTTSGAAVVAAPVPPVPPAPPVTTNEHPILAAAAAAQGCLALSKGAVRVTAAPAADISLESPPSPVHETIAASATRVVDPINRTNEGCDTPSIEQPHHHRCTCRARPHHTTLNASRAPLPLPTPTLPLEQAGRVLPSPPGRGSARPSPRIHCRPPPRVR